MLENIEEIYQWYNDGTIIVADCDISEDRFIGVRVGVVGKITSLPDKWGVLSIDGKNYCPFTVKKYSENEANFAIEFANILSEEIQKEIDKEILQEILNV